MKILMYGGCHALVMKRLIDELGPPGRHQVDLLINFQLHRSGTPFPYERLPDYDAVIYSPVENKGDHNTCHLDEACRAANVPAIRFPWLEWHGYAPSADKDVFWGHVGWFFPGLIAASREHDDFTSFAAASRDQFPADDAITSSFCYSTDKLKRQEEQVGCEIRVSDFILDGFRDRRMFLLPDHPTLLLYRHVMEQAERLVGERLVAHWPDEMPEPQPEASTPIFPRVAEALGLSFRDEAWRCETQPLQPMSLTAFLALHFTHGHLLKPERERDGGNGRDFKIATACRATLILPSRPEPGARGPVAAPIFSQILIRSVPSSVSSHHFQAEIISHLAGSPQIACLTGERLFRNEDWICRP